jgi:hypothetical protein
VASIPHFIRVGFAKSSRTVFMVMAGVMAAATLVALLGLERGRQEEPAAAAAKAGLEPPAEQP